MKLLIAEKPSVARDIARALDVPMGGRQGCFTGPTLSISWCLGHLAELQEPASYDPAWKRWSLASLPMLPERFEIQPISRTHKQFKVLRALLRDRRFETVINACDAGREGELIFRFCYKLAGARLPVERLWLRSLTKSAIRQGFAHLQPGSDYEALEQAARGRSYADWLVGMNATRAYTLKAGVLRTIGRVQTPTLALLVERDRAIESFEPQDFWELHAQIAGTRPPAKARWFYGQPPASAPGRLARPELAESLRTRLVSPLKVESIQDKTEVLPPPQLFDLNAVQRTAHRRFGLSAARCLKLLQELYERDKLLTYPRTDSRYVTADVASGFAALVKKLAGWQEYAALCARIPAGAPLARRGRYVDDRKVRDHHAILPTGAGPKALSGEKRKLFDLVVRQFLAIFSPDARFAKREAVLRSGPEGPQAPKSPGERGTILTSLPASPDRFLAQGKVCLQRGWQEVIGVAPKARKGETALPDWQVGQVCPARFVVSSGRTQPPPHYNDASLIGALEHAGRQLDEQSLRKALAVCGLGTPATRAATIETLIGRKYIERRAKSLLSTEAGRDLIEHLPVAALRSPKLTAEWEQRLEEVASGRESLQTFLAGLKAWIADIVAAFKALPESSASDDAADSIDAPCPVCGQQLRVLRSRVRCAECSFKLERRLAGRPLSIEELSALLRGQATALLQGFRSRKGKTFAARLQLKEDGALDWQMPASRKRSRAPRNARGKRVENLRKGREQVRKKPRTSRCPDAGTPTEQRCPLCGKHTLLVGHRAWGCGGWQNGCRFVLPFKFRGKALSAAQFRALVEKRKTRLATWPAGEGRPQGRGRLVLQGKHLKACLLPED